MADKHGRKGMCGGMFCFFLSLVFFFLAALLPGAVKKALDDGIYDAIVLDSPTASAYASWANTSHEDNVPVQYDVTLFTLTNPDQILNGEPPHLEELPTFKFIENTIMFDVSWMDNDDIIKFSRWQYYTFNGDIAPEYYEPATILRPSFAAAYAKSPLVAEFVIGEFAAATGLNYTDAAKEVMFVTAPVGQLLWGGYEDMIVTTGGPGVLGTNYTNTTTAFEAVGYTSMFTGKHTRHKLREYVTYNELAIMQCCNGLPCGPADVNGPADMYKPVAMWNTSYPIQSRIRGVLGTQFHPFVDEAESLPVYVSDMYRPLDIVYSGVKYKVHDITLLRFELDQKQLMNTTLNPASAAFHVTGPSGMQGIGACSQGVPLFVSKPHFLDVSSDVLATVDIAPPNKELHDPYIGIEHASGASMDVHERLQGSMYTDYSALRTQSGTAPMFPNFKKAYVPYYWVDKHAAIDEHLADKFKKSVFVAEDTARDGRIAFFVLGPLCLLTSIVLMYFAWPKYVVYAAASRSSMKTMDHYAGGEYADLGN